MYLMYYVVCTMMYYVQYLMFSGDTRDVPQGSVEPSALPTWVFVRTRPLSSRISCRGLSVLSGDLIGSSVSDSIHTPAADYLKRISSS